MNKAELIDALAKTTHSTKVECEKHLDAFVKVVGCELEKKNDVKLIGFGTFTVSHRKARTGLNPQTGAEIKIPSRDVPVFRAGKDLKELLK